jgi:ribose 5-phosphate isomerase RpiB
MMKVAIAADHAGLPLRPTIADAVRAAGHEPLQTEGADAFVKSWDDLLACIGSKSDEVRTAN